MVQRNLLPTRLKRPMRAVAGKVVDASRHHPVTWRYVYNLVPTLAYRLAETSADAEVQRVLHDLNRDGVAATSVNALFGSASPIWDAVTSSVDRLESKHAREIETMRASAHVNRHLGEKSYQFALLGEEPILEPNNPLVRISLEKPVLSIVHGYFELFAQLRFFNVWHTVTTNAEARQSQLWHRDGGRLGDRYMLKMFIYLSDVDEGSGPFCYAKGSHYKQRLPKEPDSILEGDGTKRTTDDQMDAVVNRSSWFTGTGARGTILFADTRGYHKGGFCQKRDRTMYVSMFTSKAYRGGEFFQRPVDLLLPAEEEHARVLRGATLGGQTLRLAMKKLAGWSGSRSGKYR